MGGQPPRTDAEERYRDNGVNNSLPIPGQQISQVIKEEEANAEQDERTTNKLSSLNDKSSSDQNKKPSMDSVEDECMIGDSQLSRQDT